MEFSSDEYLSLAEPGRAHTRVLGSRFLGTALPVRNMEDIESHLDAERRQYYDATHWCFAYRLGVEPQLSERASDAGEPKGTAGTPILREIQGRGLTNCLVIVTRYFGGTKLGTGNLARAYADCAAQALDAATTARVRILESYAVTCPYELVSIVYHIAQKFNAELEPLTSDTQAVFHLRIAPALAGIL